MNDLESEREPRSIAKMLAAIALVCVCAAPAAVTPATADPTGFAFLKIPAGARASALGGAYTALAEGADGAFWNPAALEGAQGIELTASHFEYFADLRQEQVALGGRMFGGGIAASMRALYSQPIPERDAIGNLIGTFGSHDLEFGLTYGRAIAAGWRLGASAQLLRERIADASAGSWAVGAGASWDPPGLHGLRLAADLHDLGPSTHYTIDGTSGAAVGLPTGARIGAAYSRAMGSFTTRLALESDMTSGQAGVEAMGLEIQHAVGLALRGGIRAGDTESTVALGAGWSVHALHLDYAFVPFRSNLGDTQRFSLATRF